MKEYITSLLDGMTRFPEISHIQIVPSEGSILAAAVGKERSIVIQVVGSPQPEINATMCLGNLKYLQKILSIEQIKNGATAQCSVGDSYDKSMQIVRNIDFAGPRLKIRYETTDPKAADSIPKLLINEWESSITLEPAHSKEFNEGLSLQKILNPSKNEFKIANREGNMYFVFETGERSAEKDVELLVGAADGVMTDPLYINTSRFSSSLSLASEASSSKLSTSKHAIKLEFTLDNQEYLIVIPKMNTPTQR